ncbi:MAG: alkaline phosphatase [Prolixibacteraceae bacterium]|nr:alkaline phosphatase [Prolixibacteraceae bacterium]
MKVFFNLIVLFALLFSSQVFGQYQTVENAEKLVFINENPYETVKVKPVKGKKVKNVILMIGDGMGLVQVSAAWVANHGKLNIDNFTSTGFSRTWCANKLITDSGAAGTAMATGTKTNYHSISVDTQGNVLTSLTDLAHQNGLKTGIVVTCNLPDATPAAFCANNIDREKEEEIAADYLNCSVDYIFGAGREKFSKRTDKRDLLDEMRQKGYQVCTNWDETAKIKQGKVFAVPMEGQLPLAKERGDLFGKASLHAIELLNKNKKGFFAMLEGSRIDDCGHWNDMPKLMEEVFDFDQTIGKVLQWAEKDGQTLVIVLADHETGGLTLLDGEIKTGTVSGNFSTKGHSGIMVPVYAYGPGAETFSGIFENTEVFHKIVEVLKLKK